MRRLSLCWAALAGVGLWSAPTISAQNPPPQNHEQRGAERQRGGSPGGAEPGGQGAGRAEHGAPDRGVEPGGANRGGPPAEMNRPGERGGQGAGPAGNRGPDRGDEPGGANRGGPPAEMNRPGRPNRPAARPQGPTNRPGAGRPDFNSGREPERSRPNYQFRQQDRPRLLQYYRRALPRVDRGHRPHFARGGYFPRVWLPYFSPVPPSLLGYLPPIPPGYAVGYYQGYVVVYDPATFFILDVIDLLS